MKTLKIVSVIFAVLVLLGFLFLFQPWALLPHDRIVIGLPFEPSEDAMVYLIPMGEKIEHNEANGNPDGHPGIDFGFQKTTGIISSTDGIVVKAGKNSAGSLDVEVMSGYYKVNYKEFNTLDPAIKPFATVKRGQLLGYTGRVPQNTGRPKEGDPSGQIHWEFKSATHFLDRLCPINYFDAESKARIESIWERIPADDQFKRLYPDICSGVFKDKED